MIKHLLIPATLLLVSCGVLEPVKDNSDSYMLEPAIPERAVTGSRPAVAIARPSLPGYLDRQQMVTRTNDGRVLTMSFSEFGRRVGQNDSQGTDHGTAAPLFLFGPMVRPGVIGEHPSLTDLDQGDLRHTIDFRSVYAGVLEGWLRSDSKPILEGSFRPIEILRKA